MPITGYTYVNKQYELTDEQQGSYSGGTWNPSLGHVPHPSAYDEIKGTIVQLNASTIGGFNGINY